MKSHTSASKTIRKTTADWSRHSAGGENAVAIAPPDYGVDFVDRTMKADTGPLLQGKFAPVQRQGMLEEEEELLQGKFTTAQRQGLEQEKWYEGQSANNAAPVRLEEDSDTRANSSGMPVRLKTGLEQLSAMDLSDLRVHYNSSKPAQLRARAYTRGHEIHLAPGQERHLPHEGWHAVQQKQGRVKPTLKTRSVWINDNPALEHEADVMGTKALQMYRSEKTALEFPGHAPTEQRDRDLKKFGATGRGKADGPVGDVKTSHETDADELAVAEAEKLKSPIGRGSAAPKYKGRGLDVLNPRMYLPENMGGYSAGKKDLRSARANVTLNNVGQGPNATRELDPDDYGICDTEQVHVTLTAHRVGANWVASATNLVGDYSKVARLPAGCQEATLASATALNYRHMISELRSLEGTDWYMLAAVDAHESVHERRLLPALKRVERGIQRRLARLSVPYDVNNMNSAAAAVNHIRTSPGYANVQAGLRNLWDAKYVQLIFADHWILTPLAERRVVNPRIRAIRRHARTQGW